MTKFIFCDYIKEIKILFLFTVLLFFKMSAYSLKCWFRPLHGSKEGKIRFYMAYTKCLALLNVVYSLYKTQSRV